MSDRVIPATCPSCATLLATGYSSHCGDRWCGWVKCNHCDTVIDTNSGRHSGGKPTP